MNAIAAAWSRLTRDQQRLAAFIAVITLARLAFAAVIPLTEDEAYYRLWAQHPAFGYYDHPPMIAWWIRAGLTLAGDDALGVRLIPVLATSLTTGLTFDLARRLGAVEAAALRAAIWFNATLTIGFGGILAVPDAADVPFWTLTLWCLARSDGPAGWRWWLAAGAAAGLGTISKYSALFLGPGILLWLLVSPSRLKALRTPWPWLAGVIAVAIFATNIAWNAEHGWVSFAKQFGRAGASRLAPQYLAELIIGQVLLLNPVIAAFLGRALGSRWLRPAAGSPDLRLPIAAAAPFAVYLVIHSLHDRVQAHWPAPLYASLALCAAAAAQIVKPGGVWARLRPLAAPFGLGLSTIALAWMALPAAPFAIKGDPAGEVRGWPAFAAAVEQARAARGAAWVGTVSYGTTAQLAAARAGAAPIAQLTERARYTPADASYAADLGKPGLVVDLTRRLPPGSLSGCFALVTPLGQVMRGDLQAGGATYSAWLVSGPLKPVLTKGCDG